MRRVGQDPEAHRVPVAAAVLEFLNRDPPPPGDVDQRDALASPFENLRVVPLRRDRQRATSWGGWGRITSKVVLPGPAGFAQ